MLNSENLDKLALSNCIGEFTHNLDILSLENQSIMLLFTILLKRRQERPKKP
jgi:hypothetical protein